MRKSCNFGDRSFENAAAGGRIKAEGEHATKYISNVLEGTCLLLCKEVLEEFEFPDKHLAADVIESFKLEAGSGTAICLACRDV